MNNYWGVICMLINDNFSSECELKQTLDFIYARSKEGKSFHGLVEVITNPITIVTAVHNIESNKGAHTAGLDNKNIDHYLQMSYEKLITLVQSSIYNYEPRPVKRTYIPKSNGKQRPLGIPTMLDRIVQECIRIILEPIVEAKFNPYSYGFRPLRACKDAIAQISATIRNNKKVKPIYAIEGDIKGFFDNVNHRILINSLFRIGISDKRLLAIIKKMLKAGYFEEGISHNTELGTPQGGILSPLLANVYLNSFDWIVGRMYQTPKLQTKCMTTTKQKLKANGVIPKYLIRYADDWIILTQSEQEANRLLHYLKKYFKHRLKIELSDEKTRVTDLTKDPAKFLGFLIKVEKPRPTPDKSYRDKLYPKIYPDHDKVKKKTSEICAMVKQIKECKGNAEKAIQIETINATIVGAMEYWKIGICSRTYTYIDQKVWKTARNTFRKIYPDSYRKYWITLNKTANRPARHQGYNIGTWAIPVNNLWVGITKASLTHSQRLLRLFKQSKTPYTSEGRILIVEDKGKQLPKDRPPMYNTTTLGHAIFKSNIYNFEYYMNREYAFNRDKGKCRVCGKPLNAANRHCHHVDNSLRIEEVNKVPNLAWVHDKCHSMIHNNQSYDTVLSHKVLAKLKYFKMMLAK